MVQTGEIPQNSPMPSGALIQSHPPSAVQHLPQTQPEFLSTAKRRREDVDSSAAGDTEESAPKRQAKAQDVVFRIVVPSSQIGKVIGKSGHRIQKIREDTKATIKIADAVFRHEERVIIISSKDNENTASDAENALQLIANLILKEDNGGEDVAKVGAVSTGHANSIKLLIAGTQAGCLIGMSGQNIEKLRSSSGASITILAPNQLPLCASAHESDRVVQISGDVPAVLKALAEIGNQLRENPSRKVISIIPANNNHSLRQCQPFVDPSSADYVTFEMVVEERFIGGLIGRCGSNISRIRVESGASIKVYGGRGEQKVRHIQFGGSSQQVDVAKQRVNECIYSQMIHQVVTQQPGLQM